MRLTGTPGAEADGLAQQDHRFTEDERPDEDLLDDDVPAEERSDGDLAGDRETQLQVPWCIAIVDDDEDVHVATVFALSGFEYCGQALHFVHAYSGREGLDLFRSRSDIAVAFVDVVMEDEKAGLNLVQAIRNELGNVRTRIILRTGQPGYAPQAEVVRRYDINDYREKGELDARRLNTTLISALRAFH